MTSRNLVGVDQDFGKITWCHYQKTRELNCRSSGNCVTINFNTSQLRHKVGDYSVFKKTCHMFRNVKSFLLPPDGTCHVGKYLAKFESTDVLFLNLSFLLTAKEVFLTILRLELNDPQSGRVSASGMGQFVRR